MEAAPDPSSDPWSRYAEAVIELLIDREHLILSPCAPEEVRQGLLADREGPVWVLTAGDPYPTELTYAENVERNDALCDDIVRLGLRFHPALGRAPDGSTSEVSVAVDRTTRDVVLSLADRYGQLAVYEISDRIRCVDVASGSVITEVTYRSAREPQRRGSAHQ